MRPVPRHAGGAIYNSYVATVTMANSTLTANVSGDGAVYNEATPNTGAGATLAVGLYNDTLSANAATSGGDNLYNDEPAVNVEAYNTIVANAVYGDGCAGAAAGDGVTDGGGNLQYGDSTCGFANTGNPELQPLANNGGPAQTLALGVGSAALQLGLPAVCAAAPVDGVDQLGRRVRPASATVVPTRRPASSRRSPRCRPGPARRARPSR